MDDLQSLTLLTLLSRVIVFLLVYLSAYLIPSFDSSHKTVLTSKWSEPLLRWDSFHFLHIAKEGYVYEHEWAFLAGAPMVMRYTGYLAERLLSLKSSPDLLLTGALAAMACDTTRTLYLWALYHLRSRKLAYLVAVLSLMSSSPATLRLTPYQEPFFAYFSYKGMLYCTKDQWFLASVSFALAGTFRSNGILLSGYILWGLLVVPLLKIRTIPPINLLRSILYTSLILSPLIYHQYTGYLAFCVLSQAPTSPPSWCSLTLPSIYTHAQLKYWNVGFLRYWTISQIPNFALAAPPLGCLLSWCFYVLRPGNLEYLLRKASVQEDDDGTGTITGTTKYSDKGEDKDKAKAKPKTKPISPKTKDNVTPRKSQVQTVPSPFLTPTLLPHTIHALILSFILLFASHTQIVLRVGPASVPVMYVAGAWLVVSDSEGEDEKDPGYQGKKKRKIKWGKLWIGWSLVWGVLSCVFWAAGLPPA
ncbi:hypothetical protein D9758_007271 [Tetrapyrgos nigripes]|uniref:GPI mannosyltransferase 2 n=1 Tax=Tetrapyrgos nigripes TaxID=182062 RepID=A0A8H5GB13_9AGAR|nr:hypothetical protein D9758_007271 [Tetrapyrgos nigripes]